MGLHMQWYSKWVLIRCFAILPNSVALENIRRKYYYETDELPNPRRTQPKNKQRLEVVFWPLFPTADNFSWVGIDFI